MTLLSTLFALLLYGFINIPWLSDALVVADASPPNLGNLVLFQYAMY